MNSEDTGRAIASLRRKAGLTQAALAEALGITDKAVSKWERGLSCPDIEILPKLSILLDSDIESILSGIPYSNNNKWKGILILSDYALDIIGGKPLFFYLLSNFALVGITEILIICNEKMKSRVGNGTLWGFSFIFSSESIYQALSENSAFLNSSCMVIYDSFIIYGAGLTRFFQAMMFRIKDLIGLISSSGKTIPLLFILPGGWKLLENAIVTWRSKDDIVHSISSIKHEIVTTARGVVFLPINNKKNKSTANLTVCVLQNTQEERIADLNEISSLRYLSKRNTGV